MKSLIVLSLIVIGTCQFIMGAVDSAKKPMCKDIAAQYVEELDMQARCVEDK